MWNGYYTYTQKRCEKEEDDDERNEMKEKQKEKTENEQQICRFSQRNVYVVACMWGAGGCVIVYAETAMATIGSCYCARYATELFSVLCTSRSVCIELEITKSLIIGHATQVVICVY